MNGGFRRYPGFVLVHTISTTGKASWGGSLGNFAHILGAFPQTTGGGPDITQLADIATKTESIPTFVAAQTVGGNPMSILSWYPMNDPGQWADASVAQFTGSITGASGTTATQYISATQSGALTGSGTAIIAAPGIPGCPQTCPTITPGAGPDIYPDLGERDSCEPSINEYGRGDFHDRSSNRIECRNWVY